MTGYRLGARLHGHDALEVARVILGIRDLSPKAVQLALGRTPAGGVVIGDDAVHPIRGQKPVRDPLGQTVLIDRIAEVVVGIDVVLTPRRRGHADLHGGLEPLQDLPPVATFARAAAMTLVDDHQIEEVARIVAVEAGTLLVAGDRLVDGEVHVAAPDRGAGDLGPCVAERAEVLGHGIVHQHVAVGQEQDLRSARPAGAVPARAPQLPAHLESHRGLAGASAEGEQDPAAPLQHRLGGPVHGDLLVVAQRARVVGQRRREQSLGHARRRRSLPPSRRRRHSSSGSGNPVTVRSTPAV